MTFALIVWLVMTVLPAIKGAGLGLFFIALVAICFTGLNVLMTVDPDEDEFGPLKWVVKQLKWVAPLLFVAMLVPNKETSWYMVGAYAAETAVTSEVAGELGQASKELMLELMNKAKAELGNITTEELKSGAKAAVEASK